MRVAEDTDVRLFAPKKCPRFFRELPTLIHDMTNGEAADGQFDHGFWWKAALLVSIDIAGHRRYGSNGLQLLND